MDTPFEILREDGPILAVNKPAGLLTQGVPAGVPTLEGFVREYIRRKYEKPGNVYLGIPHRLDRSTSGVIVFARNSKAAARLGEQFEKRQVRKEYVAIVEGVPEEPSGTLTDWLLKRSSQAHVDVVPSRTSGAKEATLRYEVLGERYGRALLRIEPVTGRMHQIRVQLAARGWPAHGDVQYGAGPSLFDAESGTVVALHARRLTILHPVRYDELSLEAPPPASWSRFGFDPPSEFSPG